MTQLVLTRLSVARPRSLPLSSGSYVSFPFPRLIHLIRTKALGLALLGSPGCVGLTLARFIVPLDAICFTRLVSLCISNRSG
jgi:hypothetical protein